MQLEEEAVKQFKNLYFKNYGITLTNQQAVEFGTRLIVLVKTVYGKNLPKRFDKKPKESK